MEIDYDKNVYLYLTKHGWTHTNISLSGYLWPDKKNKTLVSIKEALFTDNRKVSYAPFYYQDHQVIFN